MSEFSRLSEMAGITASDDERIDGEVLGTVWPLNAALVALGAAILAVSFYFLDTDDPRILFNPWTYAIATPVAVVLFSTLLSSVVSRVVEKSMQMAFLLSVLIHLLLLVYAVNIVIFSRMWPDVLDSLAAERQQLKREALQAKQYHVITSSSAKSRPDHMRLVPTQHQPTKIDEVNSPAIQLARAERANLVTPVPRHEPTVSSHLLERKQAVTSTPLLSEAAAALSRSELRQDLRSLSMPEQSSTQSMVAEPPKLEATSAAASRRRRQDIRLDLATSAPTPEERRNATDAGMQRYRSDTEIPDVRMEPQVLAARGIVDAAAPRSLAIEANSPANSISNMPALTPNDRSTANSRRMSGSSGVDRRLPELQEASSSTVTAGRLELAPRERAVRELQLPSPAAGQTSTAIARDTAGGLTGALAPSSIRVQGPDELATSAATQGELRAAASALAKRGTVVQSTAASLLEIGEPSSATWNGQSSISGGVAGTSPSQLANSAAAGRAAVADVAGLSGSGGAIERSEIGLSGQRGSFAPPVGAAAMANPVAPAGAANGGLEGSLELEPGEAGLARTGRERGQATLAPSDLAVGTEAVGSMELTMGLPGGVQRADRYETKGLTEGSIGSRSEGIARSNDVVGRSPGASAVKVPGEFADELIADQANFAAMPPSGELTRNSSSRSTASAAIPLEINALPGAGGVAPTLDTAGPLLPRRRDYEPPEITPPQIETQRFSRQDVGGPLAAGSNVALPKPAFQQRLDRLQDRDSQTETAIDPRTEQSIERGLAYLARHQRPDGSWRLQDFDTPVLMRSDTAATGLALLAFQGAGYTHKQSKYAEPVGRALKFLAEHQAASGDLYIPQDPASNQNAWLYSHGIAALAVCEAYGMTQDPELRPLAQKSIDFMVSSQDKQFGGWRYRPGQGTDTSVTGWFMMAFKSGQLAGLDVPTAAFQRIEAYLQASQLSPEQPHLYRYNPFAADTPQQRHGLRPTAVMTSVGLLMRLYFGWQRERPEMLEGTDYILDHLPRNGTRAVSLRDTYYWYYATQVIFHMGGERWNRWHDELYPLLINSQILDGEHEGSWDPMLPTPDLWARYGGRLYVTTLNLLSLEVSYRHLPLYEATAPNDDNETGDTSSANTKP